MTNLDLSYADYCWDGHSFRQCDLTITQVYDRNYLEQRYAAIAGNVFALAEKRLDVLRTFTGTKTSRLLDYGCGTGQFVDVAKRMGHAAYGHDLVYYGPDTEYGYGWNRSRFIPNISTARPFDVVTFFDSLEHLTDPAGTIAALHPEWLMISVPECHYPNCEGWFMPWKHRRPGEHLWHWNRQLLDKFLAPLGYKMVMHSTFEDEHRPNPQQHESNILTGIYHKS